MNILIIGLGSIAKKHVKALQELNFNHNIFALRSASNAPQEKDVVDILTLAELNVAIDFVIISNPTSHHFSTIKKVLVLNCPIFIEKPSLDSLENSEKLETLLAEKKILTYVACNLRFNPCIKYVKNYLANNDRTINEVNVYCGSYLPDWRPGKDFRKTYSADKELGGGVHLDLIHELDYIYWIFGQPTLISKTLKNNSSLNISSIDYANYSLAYNTFVVNITLNYFRKDSKRTFEILFDDKTWMVDLIHNTIIDNENNLIYSSLKTMSDTYKDQMHYFLECLKFNRLAMNNFSESIEVLKIAL